MGVVVATMTRVELNAVDFTPYVENVELAVDADEIDSTTMASGGWKEVVGGLKAGTMALNLQNDFAAGAMDATLWPLIGSVIAYKVRPTTAAVSATNPEYRGNVLVKNLKVVPAQVGTKMVSQLQWPTSGAMTRNTA